MKKKILFLITKSNFGGAQRYVYDIARSLPKEQYDVVVAFGGDGVLKEKLSKAGIRTIQIPKLGRDIHMSDDFAVFRNIYSLIKKEHPDIIHLNSSKIGGIGALAGRVLGVPRIIFTAHGWAFNEERPLWQKATLWILSWVTVLLTHKTIAVSKQIKQQLAHLPFVKNKMTVVYNGIEKKEVLTKDEAREYLAEQDTTLKEVATKDPLWVGTISELHTTKGLAYTINAIEQVHKKCPEVIFVVIGEGDERTKLERMIAERGLTSSVFLLGFIKDAERYLAAFDIFTLTSISEALSLSILEAGIAKKSVVASNVGGIPEIITHKESGLLIPARNPQAITNALFALIEDKTLRTTYGENLCKKVVTDFSLARMTEETQAIYKT